MAASYSTPLSHQLNLPHAAQPATFHFVRPHPSSSRKRQPSAALWSLQKRPSISNPLLNQHVPPHPCHDHDFSLGPVLRSTTSIFLAFKLPVSSVLICLLLTGKKMNRYILYWAALPATPRNLHSKRLLSGHLKRKARVKKS
jgi:hypothetical protein